jgi:hydrogenase-4 component F
MTALIIAAPLLAALVTMAFRPIEVRRNVRVALSTIAAFLPLLLARHIAAPALLFAMLVSLLSYAATLFSTGVYTIDWGVGDVVWSRKSVYFALLGAFWSAMLLVVLSGTFPVMWLGIALTTAATTFLVGFSGERDALEAAWKYLVLCSVGIAIALLGILAWGGAGGNAGLERIGIALMLLGFATKAGLVPMHAWLPDAHSKAPAPISSLLSGVLVTCSLYAIMRVSGAAEAAGEGAFAHWILLVAGTCSISVAGILMLVQTDLKRLLAYSTVEHSGIVALAVAFGGPLGISAAILHALNHAVTKSGAFLAAGAVQQAKDGTSLRELHGLWSSGSHGRMLILAMAGLCGLPPFGLVISELLVVAAGVAAQQWLALAFGIAGMALGFVALARAAIEIASARRPRESPRPVARRSLATTAAVLVGAFALAWIPWTPAGAFIRTVAATVGGAW